MRPRRGLPRAAAVTFCGVVAWGAALPPGTARAQPSPGLESGSVADDVNFDQPLDVVAAVISAIVARSQGELFKFLETVELLNAEAEIDRLVGDPRALNDATAYKLGLLPFHIRFPIYKQLVRQMTRQDDLRSRRIHNTTPESAPLIALQLDALSDDQVEAEVRRSILRHFNAREIIDLGFFMAAQQPFFPETDEGWRALRRNIADRAAAAAAVVVLTGAAFNVGAFSQSGRIARSKGGGYRLGWYGGFRELGFGLRPYVRAGLTVGLPRLDLAVGLAERLRPLDRHPSRVLELAIRESWFADLVRPHGWDLFGELALRRVLATEGNYRGENTTARVGVFFRRDHIRYLRNVSLRGSAEAYLPLEGPAQHAVGLGLEHAPTGLTTMLQASRSPSREPGRAADTRGGVFLAGTMEPFTQVFVDAMNARARQVRDAWETLSELDQRRARADQVLRRLGTRNVSREEARTAVLELESTGTLREEQICDLSGLLAEYLESRRRSYSLARWNTNADDLHGPLPREVLVRSRAEVHTRLGDLTRELGEMPPRLQLLRERHSVIQLTLEDLQTRHVTDAAVESRRRQAAAILSMWRRESEIAGRRLDAYARLRDSTRRIGAVTGFTDELEPPSLPARAVRTILTLRTLPLR